MYIRGMNSKYLSCKLPAGLRKSAVIMMNSVGLMFRPCSFIEKFEDHIESPNK